MERKGRRKQHCTHWKEVMSSHVTNLSYSPRLNPAGITSEEHIRRLLKMLVEKWHWKTTRVEVLREPNYPNAGWFQCKADSSLIHPSKSSREKKGLDVEQNIVWLPISTLKTLFSFHLKLQLQKLKGKRYWLPDLGDRSVWTPSIPLLLKVSLLWFGWSKLGHRLASLSSGLTAGQQSQYWDMKRTRKATRYVLRLLLPFYTERASIKKTLWLERHSGKS